MRELFPLLVSFLGQTGDKPVKLAILRPQNWVMGIKSDRYRCPFIAAPLNPALTRCRFISGTYWTYKNKSFDSKTSARPYIYFNITLLLDVFQALQRMIDRNTI
jgi:hypothetical protein